MTDKELEDMLKQVADKTITVEQAQEKIRLGIKKLVIDVVGDIRKPVIKEVIKEVVRYESNGGCQY